MREEGQEATQEKPNFMNKPYTTSFDFMKTLKTPKVNIGKLKPSALIMVAIEDLKKVKEDKETYRIIPSTWHCHEGGKCSVCFAGAVMAGTLNIPPRDYVEPYYFKSKKTERALLALDLFRRGEVGSGLYFLGIPISGRLEFVNFKMPRNLKTAKFIKAQLALAKELKEAGL